LNELKPQAGLLPADRAARTPRGLRRNALIYSLRSALPMNLKGHFPEHSVGLAMGDIERITTVWRECLSHGDRFTMPARWPMRCTRQSTRFRTYDVEIDDISAGYCQRIRPCPRCKSGSPPPD
jgi:glutathione S-transferase